MLTGFKVSAVACKCAFYRQEHNAKGDPILKCKNEIYQRIELKDEKNRVICLVIMSTPEVIVNKMSKMAIFLHFLR